MSLLKKFLGIGSASESERDTETVRRIAAELDQLPHATARHLAGFAYILARVANADLEIDSDETAEMERITSEVAELSEAEAALVVQIAKSQARLLGETENYVVTREFKSSSSAAQRSRLLECLFAVAAADGTISTTESAEIVTIGGELGFGREEISAVRSRYRDQLAEFQNR